MERAELYRTAQDTLRRHALDNRGMLPPARLNQIGTTLVDLLLDGTDAAQRAATLAQQGLALSSILATSVALQRALLADGDVEGVGALINRSAQITVAVNQAEIALMRDEHERMRSAVSRVLMEQQAEASRLTSLIHELSTPIMPVYDGILVLPLVGAIDSRRSIDIMEHLLSSIAQHHADSVIIDITGVSVVDTGVAQHLLQTARAANLLGSSVILVGISPEIAQTITQLGIEVGMMTTLSNLQAGITFALQRRGMTIAPFNGRPALSSVATGLRNRTNA